MSNFQSKFTASDGVTVECTKGSTIDARGEKPDRDWIGLKIEAPDFSAEAQLPMSEGRALMECLQHYFADDNV